jgi:hypothetical protein
LTSASIPDATVVIISNIAFKPPYRNKVHILRQSINDRD